MPSWTKAQQKVIDLRGKNILVAAAAGSGKTAVLTERILELVCDPAHPVDIDRLLVLTFTKAAAGEMKERVEKKLADRLAKDPCNHHLRRQTALIHHAQITTIDSFCLNIVRNYFTAIDLDPGFRIADEGETKLLRADAMADLLEEEHQAASEEFLYFLESFGAGKTDHKAEEYIDELYDNAVSDPDPAGCLNAWADLYASGQETEQSEWIGSFLNDWRTAAAEYMDQLEIALELCREPDGPISYEEALESDLLQLKQLKEVKGLWSLKEDLSSIDFIRLKKSTSPSCGQVKAIRDAVKDGIKKDWKDRLKNVTPELLKAEEENAGRNVKELCRLTNRYFEIFGAKKREKGVLDFSDIEHFALQILTEKDGETGEIRPSFAALELAESFDEIMIDEYQDSNRLQETILNTLSDEENGRYHTFRVGDVKQSIYKFRQARPELFMEKYRTYGDEGNCVKVELSRNFRSRGQVLADINRLFDILMRESVGGIEYNSDCALYHGKFYPGETDLDGKLIEASVSAGVQEQPEKEAGEAAAASKESGQADQEAGKAVGTAEESERADQEADHVPSPEGLVSLPKEPDYKTEFLVAFPEENEEGSEKKTEEMEQTSGEEEEQTLDLLEASMTAARIVELTDPEKGLLISAEDKAHPGRYLLHRANYRDVVILLRSFGGKEDSFRRALEERGIPTQVQSRTGYYSAWEVQVTLDLLQVIDNPRQDEPLAAVLHSPYAGLTSREMAVLKGEYEAYLRTLPAEEGEDVKKSEARMWDAAVYYPEAGTETGLKEKLQAFLIRLESFRQKAKVKTTGALLAEIYETTGFPAVVRSMPGGERRKANLDMLLKKAEDYDATSYRGLFSFIRYIDNLKKYSVEQGEAEAGAEENAVRIMTIHKSKGLEFPICFVCGMNRQFNDLDSRSQILISPEWGLAADYVDPEKRVRHASFRKKVFASRIRREARGEDLRVLYVAATRASEKLIFTAAVSDFTGWKGKNAVTLQEGEKLPETRLLKAQHFSDWLMMAGGGDAPAFDLRPVPAGKILHGETVRYKELLNKEKAGLPLPELSKEEREEISGRLDYAYPYMGVVRLSGKVSVSELKKQSQEEEFSEAPAPFLFEQPEEKIIGKTGLQETAEMKESTMAGIEDRPETGSTDRQMHKTGTQEKGPEAPGGEDHSETGKTGPGPEQLSGAELGTLYHKCMELYPFADPAGISALDFLRGLSADGRLTEEEINALNPKKLEGFFSSPLADRMRTAEAAGHLHRETPFALGLSAEEVYPGCGETETILVQGVIDAWFEENGQIVLLDYKTDHVSRTDGEDVLRKRYYRQLEIYRKALEQILEKKVSQMLIYSFALNREFDV